MEMKLQLSGETMRRFHVAQIFEESHKHKKSLSFSRDGLRLVVCDHKNLSIFNCATCTLICQVHMHPYRPEAVCFTPKGDRLLHSATKMDFAIRYLNLSTRQYERLFSGHKLDVLDLCLQPGSDHCFVSAGRDKRLLLWDLRTPQPTQQLDEVQNPLIACDPTGKVIATCKTSKCIEIYDVRMLEANPCQRFRYQVDSPATWTQLQFSPDGKALLVATDYSCCFSVDAYNGGILQAYTGWRNSRHLPLKTCYTPDSQFVLAGADRGCVHVWHATSGRTIEVLESNSVLPIQCIRFNPEKMMFVTCDVRTCFWQIREKREREGEEDAKQTAERQERLHRHEKEVAWMMEQEQRLKREKEQRDKQMEEQRVKQKAEEEHQKMKQKEQNKQVEQVEQHCTEEEEQEEIELQVQREEQEEIEQQVEEEREKQAQQEEPLPRKRLRSAIEIPTIDLTCIGDSSSSEQDDELKEAHKQWEYDHKWVRGTMVRRRIVSMLPCPIKFPRPRRWQLWRQRRSPCEEGELPDDY